ncbi:hypothetical protein THRCLA_04455 [Thraustotheca clavata]|uniref:Thiamine phosphate synthase/TenI domain-containing protein n=1 Tax=Thraustotheca clavata TaxID=74557 RepID=A0A1V9ZYZ4_9STRA|nr:hypothetical protein THRCLA_04455 [Thraustotheca clavata]
MKTSFGFVRRRRLLVLIASPHDVIESRALKKALKSASIDAIQLRNDPSIPVPLSVYKNSAMSLNTMRNNIKFRPLLILNAPPDSNLHHLYPDVIDYFHYPERSMADIESQDIIQNGPPYFGVSVHSIDTAEQAINMGAFYLQVGTMFPTTSHPEKNVVEGPKLMQQIRQRFPSTPLIGIGGISQDNCSHVLDAGANDAFMGLFDGWCGSLEQSPRRPTVSFAARSDHEGIAYEEETEFNSAWRYYDESVASHEDAEEELQDTPKQTFILWKYQTLEKYELYLSLHTEIKKYSHQAIGTLQNGWNIVHLCGKKWCLGSNCSSCYTILHLDEYLAVNHPRATVGLRFTNGQEGRLHYLEVVSWHSSTPATSMQLYLQQDQVVDDMQCVNIYEGAYSAVKVISVRSKSALEFAGVQPGFSLCHVNSNFVQSVQAVFEAVSTSSSLYVCLHFQAPEAPSPTASRTITSLGDIYQVTFVPLPNRGIEHLGDIGLRFRKVMDMICVVDVSGYAASRNVRRGSLILRINGTRTPFLSFDRLSEFSASSSFFRLPVTLDFVALPQENYFLEKERSLISASLIVYQMAKVAEQLRIHFHTLHSYVLCRYNLSNAFDTSAFAPLGPAIRKTLLPFIAPRMLSSLPIPADMVRLLTTLKGQYGRICEMGTDAIEFALITVYSLCYIEEVSVHREAVHSFRELIKLLPMENLLTHALPLITTLKSNSKTILRAASVSLWLEYLRRLQTQAMVLNDEDERMPNDEDYFNDMNHLRWRHQVLEAGVAFAELSSDLEPAVSCAARQHLTTLVQELIIPEPSNTVHWSWIVPLVEALSKALMPDGRLDALHLTCQLAPWTSPEQVHWRWRLALVFASLANDGNDLIRKVAAQKFVPFVEYIQIQDLAALYDSNSHVVASSPHSNSMLEMSDIRWTERERAISGARGIDRKRDDDDDRPRGLSAISWLGSASIDSDNSDARRRCLSIDSIHQITSGESTHHVLFALMDGYMNLMQDAPTDIKKIICRSVGRVAELFGHEILVKFLIPTIQDVIVRDMDDCKCHGSSAVYDSIHHILMRELCQLAPLFVDDPEGMACDILPFIVNFLSSPVQHTHLVVEALENLDYLGYALGKDAFVTELAPILAAAVDNPEWKVRVAVAYNLGPLLQWLGTTIFMQHFKKLVETLCQDLVYQVRNLALQPMQLLFEGVASSSALDIDNLWRQYALDFVTSVLVCHANYQMRVAAIHWFAAVAQAMGEAERESYLYPTLSKLAKDPVANVRVVCARELGKNDLPEALHTELTAGFQEDADMDVQFFAKDDDDST